MPFIIRIITDSFSISIILSISIYNALVYLGRRKYESDLYNLYFSLFIFSIALFIFFDNSLITLIFNEKILPYIIFPAIYLSLFFENLFYTKFLSAIIRIPRKINIIFYIFYILFFANFLTTFTSFIYGYQWFSNNLENNCFIFYIVLKILITSILIYYSFKNNVLKDKSSLIILTGTLIIILYIILIKLILIFNINFFLRNNYIFVGLTAITFAYVLSKRFNNEFKELVDLKNALEEKVKTRTQELLEAKEKIEKESELKSNFFINLSHEIKTPLTLIDNYFNKHIEEIGESDSIKIVRSNINKLKKDIINIFDIEKINKGKMLYIHDKTINASLFIEKQLLLFKEMADEKKIRISSSLENNILLKIDPYALDRILNNLIDNALKYTDENGEIKIILKKHNSFIELIVEDNGCGIPDEFKEHIFDPYYQITSKKSNLQGIGMGLAIVKSIVDELNGKIYLESSIGTGTKITIKLNDNINYLDNETIVNFNYYKPINIEESIQLNEEFNNSMKTILIVEDNNQMLNYLYSVLKTDLNVYYSKNGKEALQKLNWIPKPDIILSDIMMDEMDGYEFYDNVKSIENLRDIPFLFLTAKTEDNEKIAGLTRGAIDYITKPFNVNELKAKLKSILANRNLFKESNKIEFKNKLSNFLDKDESKNKIYETMLKYNINNIELKIIELLMDGAEYKEISDSVNISLSSIKKRIHEIYKKLGIQNKIELIKLFKKNI